MGAGISGLAAARELTTHDADRRRDRIVNAVTELLGPQAAELIAYKDLNWTWEPWGLGAPVSLMAPGTRAAGVQRREDAP